jgi:hypothetical protein
MASTALTSWKRERRKHLDDLLDAHKLVGGPAPESLALLNDARNGLAHSDDAKLASLRDKGHPPVLSTFRRWRRDLDILAANLDAETSGQLARLFDRKRPW